MTTGTDQLSSFQGNVTVGLSLLSHLYYGQHVGVDKNPRPSVNLVVNLKRKQIALSPFRLFPLQYLAHHDAVDDVAAGPAQLEAGTSHFSDGFRGLGGGEGSKLLIVAGIISFAVSALMLPW